MASGVDGAKAATPAKAAAPAKRAARGRGRPTDQSAEETRTAILVTAQKMFGAAGYQGVSMEALAAECGLNARAIYYHFDSKRALFDAAANDAFAHFGVEVADRVFRHDSLRDRISGYVEVYRRLHESDPHVVPFIGMFLVDLLGRGPASATADDFDQGHGLQQFLEVLVDQARERGEVHPDVDRDGALLLLTALGMGLSLASLNDGGAFPAMLDTFDRLHDGTLFT